ncbi:uncharacterized protein ACLA_050680 [Aspergillus clavatus NRRL 1]|uniref:Uncharacterized protein n=1 Tax=Aspergillus clavatus (strain ATCC 1007 / CBS 513.65 / DSM 816 / NCTC 3887 / NRRL 1 / QM 1276 / 107) TaxID=344612 RepID=A1CI91_ASPCL|nr:uncharacterized protein ACLA_050680 [Aspergillus clavatus NRRL 1]EAW10596.1 conserved hypothetical protein [Aspergillus clavatus NRRL 1]
MDSPSRLNPGKTPSPCPPGALRQFVGMLIHPHRNVVAQWPFSSDRNTWRNTEKRKITGRVMLTILGGATGTPEPSTTPLVNPSSALLQDLLREQRATRASRGPAPDEYAEYMPHTPERSQSQSQAQEDAGSEKQRKVNSALSAGHKQPREMGIREMDQYISKINKQNFDLKLDIFHRAQQMAVLEKKLERMQQLEEEAQRTHGLEEELQELRGVEEDNQRLRESNEQLRQEIDKRDQAVTEAVELICQLEAKIEELETTHSSRPTTARPPTIDGSEVATPRACVTPDIPERSSSRNAITLGDQRRVSSGSRSLSRAPSFLREEHHSTAALRSLYITSESHPRPARSAMTQSESMNSVTEATEAESPRLSALSECSELMPYDTSKDLPVFDQIQLPVLEETIITKNTASYGPDTKKPPSKHARRSGWHQTQLESLSKTDTKKGKDQGRTVTLKTTQTLPFDNDIFLHGHNQKTRLENVFGSSRLPPTPDTMSTACATTTNRSNSSNAAEKAQPAQPSPARRKLHRPRSADEMTTRRSSINDAVLPSLNPNLSDVTLPRPSVDEDEETPVMFPLNGIPSKTSYFLGQRSSRRGMAYFRDVDDVLFNPVGIERVISKMEKDHYSPPASLGERTAAAMAALSPPLTPEDWIEAAKPGPRPTKKRPSARARNGAAPEHPETTGARAPSQSAFLARRHSVDSTIRNPSVSALPALALSRNPQPPAHEERDQRRRVHLRPPFLDRLTQPRRLQPSPITDSEDSGDGAPSPVIRKNRPIRSPKPLRTTQDGLATVRGHGELCVFALKDGDGKSTNAPQKTLPHSLTESNFRTHASTMRPSTSGGKEHKRRSSLSIFGWMKGGIGSHRKAGIDNSGTIQIVGKERPSSRWARETPGTISETEKSDGTDTSAQNSSSTMRHKHGKEDDNSVRRPRYVERRPRRS